MTNAPLKDLTWFRVGGPAEVLFRPADQEDLRDFLKHGLQMCRSPSSERGQTLLVRDGGIPGVTIRLGRDSAGSRTAMLACASVQAAPTSVSPCGLVIRAGWATSFSAVSRARSVARCA